MEFPAGNKSGNQFYLMTRKVTSRSFAAGWFVNQAMLVLLISIFFCSAAFSQNAGIQQELGDLSSISWKSQSDLNAAIAHEQAKMDVMLAAPNLPLTDRSIFLCYQRLAGYVQADVQAGTPVHDAIENNYVKVLKEATLEPDLKHLPDHSLSALIPGLVEALTELQVAAPAAAQ